MPKSSSERSSKLEFSDSEFVFGGGLNLMVVLTLGMGVERGIGICGEMVIWGMERVVWGVVQRGIWGEMGIWLVETDVEGCGEGDLEGGDLCLFCQARRVVGESGGGIGITGEPAHCSVSVFFS